MSNEALTFLILLPLAAVLTLAMAVDIRSRRIPNSLIVTGWAIALAWHLIGPPGSWTFHPENPGAVGGFGAILGLAGLLVAFLPFYVMRFMGAGDVKLMSVVGAFFGATPNAWAHLVGVSLLVLASGGLLAIVRILATRSAGAVRENLRLIFSSYAGRALGMPAPSFDPRTDSVDRMPYAVAIATGTILYLVAKWAGWITVL